MLSLRRPSLHRCARVTSRIQCGVPTAAVPRRHKHFYIPPETKDDSINRISKYRSSQAFDTVLEGSIPRLKLENWSPMEKVRLGGAMLKWDRWAAEDVRKLMEALELERPYTHFLYIRAVQNAFLQTEEFSAARTNAIVHMARNAVDAYVALADISSDPEHLRALHLFGTIAKHPFPNRSDMLTSVYNALSKHRVEFASPKLGEVHLVPLYIAIMRSSSHSQALTMVKQRQDLGAYDYELLLTTMSSVWHPREPVLPPKVFRELLDHTAERGILLKDRAHLLQTYLRRSIQAWNRHRGSCHSAMAAPSSDRSEYRAKVAEEKKEFGEQLKEALRDLKPLPEYKNFKTEVSAYFKVDMPPRWRTLPRERGYAEAQSISRPADKPKLLSV